MIISMQIILVKPHPPVEIMMSACPTPEKYKYAWEPIALKVIAYAIQKHFPDVAVEVFHCVSGTDDEKLLSYIKNQAVDIVIFSEIDVLVNSVSYLATKIKETNSKILTVVGGKQTSLLRAGDRFPFSNIDYAFRGGPQSVLDLVQILKSDSAAEISLKGRILVDSDGIVEGNCDYSDRLDYAYIDNIRMRKIPVINCSHDVYFTHHQRHPSIHLGEVRTSAFFSGEGCPYNCVFCQSPIEYRGEDKVKLCSIESVANEILWLHETYGVNNFFSLEPNLNLGNLKFLYQALGEKGVPYLSTSGFVRAGDIKMFYKNGILKRLIDCGLRFVSIGIDVPVDTKKDVYNKSYSYNDMLESLNICMDHGLVVLATCVGDPTLTKDEFKRQLETIQLLPVGDVDIRLAIALRNTKYFNTYKEYLIYSPDDSRYFDCQNYRYQTIQIPGKIKPEETYSLVNAFYTTFYHERMSKQYVQDIIASYPDTRTFFSS